MLIISMAACLAGGLISKYFLEKAPKTHFYTFIFNGAAAAVVVLTLLCMGGFGEASAFTILLGFAFGFTNALQAVTRMMALNAGPLSYTSVIISFSTVISALSGIMFFDESIGWPQIVGIILMLFSFYFAVQTTGEEKKANLRWLILSLISFAGCGAIGIMQKVHQNTDYKTEINAFLIISFITMAVTCFICALVLYMKATPKERAPESTIYAAHSCNAPTFKAPSREFIIFFTWTVITCGICTALNNKFNLYLSGVIDSAVFFPLVNGGHLVLSTLAALVIFKEKLSKTQWVGVAIGIASVIFLCNPFG